MTSLAKRDGRMLLAGAIGICVLTASSYVSVPLYPVPVTMQTLAVLLVGVVIGPRAGALTVLSWLALSLGGAPLLAGGGSGPGAFVGPTAGYLASFPIAAFLAGMLPRAESAVQHAILFAAMLGLHVLILFMGWLWLAGFVGPAAAMTGGVVPFLIGGVLKAALATAGCALLPQRWRL
ncbi:MAG: biotin transporter BioY [Pseudomonadota bacterium]